MIFNYTAISIPDSLEMEKLIIGDSLKISNDNNEDSLTTESKKISKKKTSGLDTNVVYSSVDTVRFNLSSKSMRIRGNSKLKFGDRNLEAEIIEIEFKNDLLKASSEKDSTGKLKGIPLLTEKGEQYAGEKIKFNFKTSKGIISKGETELDEGFYFGERIKRISQTEFFIENGFYTPCDENNPGTYFGSPKMKMVAKNKVFLDPLIFYLQDMPILMYPFGIFFPTESGRKSGLIVPAYSFTSNQGIRFTDLGFYWAASDYFDSKFLVDIYTKGGYLFKNQSIFKYQDKFSLNSNIENGYVRTNVNQDYKSTYSLDLNSNWMITPQDRVTANLRFSAVGHAQNTSTDYRNRITQEATSNASYSSNFDNGQSMSMVYNRSQDLLTPKMNQGITFSYNIPKFNIIKILDQDLSFNVKPNVVYNENHNPFYTYDTTYTPNDTSFIENEHIRFSDQKRMSFSPSISYNFPKMFFMNISPYLDIDYNMYFRKKISKSEDSLGVSQESYEGGLFPEYSWNYGVELNTTIYGMAQPDILGLKAIRHTMKPKLRYRINPDFSESNFDFYRNYTDRNGEVKKYNVFEKDGGSHAPSTKSQSIDYSLSNRFEIKVGGDDSTDAEKIELLQLDLFSSYNFELDSFAMNDIRVSLRTPALKILNFSGGAMLSPYKYIPIYSEDGELSSYRKSKDYLIDDSGFLDFTGFNFTLSTSLSADGLNYSPSDTPKDKENLDTTAARIGQRFTDLDERLEYKDVFGDSSPGYTPFSMPWNININLTYSYEKYRVEDNISFSSQINLNFTLAESWRISAGGYFDLIKNELNTPNISVTKELECWNMSFNWVPMGTHRSFYFKIGMSSAQLKDFMYEKRGYSYY